jgi:putative Ca2+/H+ antiporter (TMEM165/GDT1 family)
MAKKDDVITAIKAAIPKPQSMRWSDRVAPEHAETLAQIEAAFLAGEFGSKRKPAYVAIAAYLNTAGISSIGHQGVREWLEKRQ